MYSGKVPYVPDGLGEGDLLRNTFTGGMVQLHMELHII